MKPLTAEQRTAVEDRGGSLLLAANAGSGKTRVLVERFVGAVLEDGVDVDRILAITFTDKAAGELRDRISEELADRGRIAEARATEGAHISTIHGFCARVLRANALRAGLDPEFSVLEEREAARLARAAFDRALEDRLAAAGEDALDVVSAYGTRDVRAMILDAHEWQRSRGVAAPDLPQPTLEDPAAARAAARTAALEYAAALELIEDPGVNVRAMLDKLDASRQFDECLNADEVATAAGLRAFAPNGGAAAALRTPAAERWRTAYGNWRRACVDHHAVPVLDHLRALLRAFAARYRDAKAERSALDFADLELLAHALLRDDAGIRAAYAERFTHVMVDEFQDTNPLQLDFLRLLDRDNLFVVGDELQSIYRFRHADVEIFRDRRDERAAAGRARELSANFRSDAALLDALNPAFERVFGERFLSLVAGAGRNGAAAEPPVEILVTDKGAAWSELELGEAQPASAIWRLGEARLLAQRLRALVDSGVREQEIVVLLRAATDMALFERALEDQGLRTYLIGGRGFWGQRQVQDVVAYLTLIANPRDDLRLYEVLASPMVGASSDTLALIAVEAGGERSAWEVVSCSEDPALAAFACRLAAHRAQAPRLALDALIDRVVTETGYDLAVLGMTGGERRLANVRKLMRLARELEAAEGRDVRGLVDLVSELAGQSDESEPDREAEAPVEGEALEAIRLMTIHRAKGLEFGVVCVADLGREPPNGGRRYLRLDAQGRVGLRLPWEDGGREDAFAWEAIDAHERLEEAEEERRLLYVACTRAQRRLILSGAIDVERWREGRACREPLGWLATALEPELPARLTEERPLHDAPLVRAALNAPATVGAVLREDALAPAVAPRGACAASPCTAHPPPAPPPPPAPARVDRLSYSALEAYGRCGYRFYLERALGLPPEPLPAAAAATGLGAADRGTLAHELLEGLDLEGERLPAADDARALANAHGLALSHEEAADLVGMVVGFAASPLARRLRRADQVRREAAFAFMLEPAGVLVTGAMDVLAREGDAALVIDYKSDRLRGRDPDAVVADDYATQRVVYALAALHSGAGAVEVAHCFLERPGEPEVARFTAADAPSLEASLRDLASGVVGGSFPVAAEPHAELCLGCPGRPALCSWPEQMTGRPAP